MRVSWRVLVAAMWLGVAGAPMAAAQTEPGTSAPIPNDCGPVCRFFQGLSGQAPAQPAPAQTAQPQTEAEQQPEIDSPRRPRKSAARRAQRREAAEDRRDPPKTVAARRARSRSATRSESEAARSSSPESSEILFVSGADETHRAITDDLAIAIGPDLTVRTVAGRDEPLRDLLAVPGVDVAITSSLTLARGSAQADKVVYLAKLFTEELHAVAAPEITHLDDLNGKAVYLGPQNSDSELAARAFLESRGIAVTPVDGSFDSAIAGLRDGRIAAAFILSPKPFAPIAGLSAADGLHLLPLVFHTSDTAFHPAALAGADYPQLVDPGERVETVALDAILVAPRWRENTERQRELAAFTARLFERLGSLNGPGRHPKWRETNLAAQVEGFGRLRFARQWVESRLKAREASRGALPQGRLAGATP